MKRAMLGSLIVLGLVMTPIALGDQRGDFVPQRAATAPAAATGTELIVVPTALGEKTQVLTIVDPKQRVLSVYHIELATGRIKLMSVRNITGDLQMQELNTEKPLPHEIRSMADPK